MITQEFSEGSKLLEQWEETLGDPSDMLRQYPDPNERSKIRLKINSLHEAFYELRESIFFLIRDKKSQIKRYIPSQDLLDFSTTCIHIHCNTILNWTSVGVKNHLHHVQQLVNEGYLQPEHISDLYSSVFKAMKYQSGFDSSRAIFNDVYDWVWKEVVRYSGCDTRGARFEVEEPFDWEYHQSQPYFRAIPPLELYRDFPKLQKMEAGSTKTLFEEHDTPLLYRWMEFVNGYGLLSKANGAYEELMKKEETQEFQEDVDDVITLYSTACGLLDGTDLGGFARTRMGLLSWKAFKDASSAGCSFQIALKEAFAEQPHKPYFNSEWAIQCREHIALFTRLAREKEERERMPKDIEVLSDKVKEVKGSQSLPSLLRWVNEAFAPPDPANQTRLTELVNSNPISRNTFRQIIRVYHPDKNSHHSKQWKNLCESITKVRSHMGMMANVSYRH